MTSTILATNRVANHLRNLIKFISTTTNGSISNKISLNGQQFKSTTIQSSKNGTAALTGAIQTRAVHTTCLNHQQQKDKIEFPPGNPQDKPKLEHLLFIKEHVVEFLPKIFVSTHPYGLCTPDMVFENNYDEPAKVTVGLTSYATFLLLLRIKAHLKYSFLKVDLLKVTHDEAESCVIVRWRVTGVTGLKSMLKPWKIKVWKIKESFKQEAEYYDGISTFFIRGDAKIVKHRVERVLTQKDEQRVKDKLSKLKNLNVNTALFKRIS